jgi:predicted small secreted protein
MFLKESKMSKFKQMIAVVFLLSLALLAGCETTKGSNSNVSSRGTPGHIHQH